VKYDKAHDIKVFLANKTAIPYTVYKTYAIPVYPTNGGI